MIDITGQKYNFLTAIRPIKKTKNRQIIWECICDCGNKTMSTITSLKNGRKKSCGCIKHKFGHIGYNKKHNMCQTKIYKTWERIRKRCRENYHERKYYFDKSICVCKEWDNLEDGFLNFLRWSLNNGYKENLTIDRIDSNGNYCPENCRWVDKYTQANNKTNNHKLLYNGIEHGISEWARIIGIPRECLKDRITKLKWTVEKALTTPKKILKRK